MKKLTGRQAIDEAIKRAAATLDDCTHPECVIARKDNGFSYCAGGHLARRVVAALKPIRRRT